MSQYPKPEDLGINPIEMLGDPDPDEAMGDLGEEQELRLLEEEPFEPCPDLQVVLQVRGGDNEGRRCVILLAVLVLSCIPRNAPLADPASAIALDRQLEAQRWLFFSLSLLTVFCKLLFQARGGKCWPGCSPSRGPASCWSASRPFCGPNWPQPSTWAGSCFGLCPGCKVLYVRT